MSKFRDKKSKFQDIKSRNFDLLCRYFEIVSRKFEMNINENKSIYFFFLFFFFFFLIWVLRPFQEYFTYIEPIVHRRWAKTGEPGEKPPDHP